MGSDIMKRYIGILIALLIILSGCVTYKDGEPVKDEAYEKRQEEKNAKKEEKNNEEKANKDVEKKEVERKSDLPIDEAIKENNDNITDADLYDEGMLIIKIDADGSFSENTLVTNQAYNILEVMNEAFLDDEVQTVDAVVKVTMIDNKGNESLSDAVNIVYTRESFKKLNYKDFSNLARAEEWRIYNEADEYLINPGIYNNLKNNIKDNLIHGSSKFGFAD